MKFNKYAICAMAVLLVLVSIWVIKRTLVEGFTPKLRAMYNEHARGVNMQIDTFVSRYNPTISNRYEFEKMEYSLII